MSVQVAVVGPGDVSAAAMLLPASDLSSDRDAYGEPAYRTNPVSREDNMGNFAEGGIELLLRELQAAGGGKGEG